MKGTDIKKIGIFDSGIGGVSVLHEAYHRLPEQEYIFYADVDHVPYGIKTPEQIIGYVDEIVSELINMDTDAIVIACNTATSVAAEYVRSKYSIPIIGMEPAVKPAVEAAVNSCGRVLVMATPVTIREQKLQKLLERVDKSHMVDLLPMPELVRFAENGIFDGDEVDSYISKQLSSYDIDKITEVVLGCTHFNYFKPAIKKAFQSGLSESVPVLVDGNAGTVKHLAEVLGIKTTESEGEVGSRTTYLLSGRPAKKEELEKFVLLHDRLEAVRGL